MIPPRPWRASNDAIFDAKGESVLDSTSDYGTGGIGETSPETAELIVRLVNAEEEIVAALEAAAKALDQGSTVSDYNAIHAQVAQALAKVRR